MSEPASISTGIATRYATAVFDLAFEGKGIPALEKDVDALDAALTESADLRDLISSPVYSRDEQAASIVAVAKKMKLSPMMSNALKLMASKRRLFVIPQMISALRARIADENGEVTAEVVSAMALTKAQSETLAKTLSKQTGKKVKITETIDESIIGGLIVKVGSKMIDTSVASKLKALQNSMKEAR